MPNAIRRSLLIVLFLSCNGQAKMPLLPDSNGTGGLMSWGGNDPLRWKPEAVLANAISLRLNRAWENSAVTDATVAVPLVMVTSNYRQFGDGQANATVNFGSWTKPRPPLVAVLVRLTDGSSAVSLFFDRELSLPENQIQISYIREGKTRRLELPLDENRAANWSVDPALDWGTSVQSDVIFARPSGFKDWFPIYFRHPIVAAKDLLAQLRPQDQILAGNRSALDPEDVSAQIPGHAPDVKASLMAHVGHFGAGFNQSPFTMSNVHGQFPTADGFVPTGVGRGWTWVAGPPTSFVKSLYMCFEKRNEELESVSGVPSAAGPHQIGIDPNPNHPGNYAGTIMNTLETTPVALASAVKSPSAEGPPSGHYAFGLKDIATVRWLKPGEGLVVPIAQSDWGYLHGKPNSVTANFHWFYFSPGADICVEGWVHPCLPRQNNGIGLNPTHGCERPSM